MKIREGKIEDFEAIQSLNILLFKQDIEFDKTLDIDWPNSDAGKNYFKKRIESDDTVTVVAEENDKVVGYMIAAFEKTPTYMRQDIKMVELENTFIEEEYRRQGIGALMYAKVEGWAKEHGANMMMVIANAQNEKAHNFYKKMGLNKTDITFQKPI